MYISLFSMPASPNCPAIRYIRTILLDTIFFCVCESLQSCMTLCDAMDCSRPGSSVHGILQAIYLFLQVAIFFSRGSSWPRDPAHISSISWTGRRILYHCALWVAQGKVYIPITFTGPYQCLFFVLLGQNLVQIFSLVFSFSSHGHIYRNMRENP